MNPPKIGHGANITRRGGYGTAGIGGWKVGWLNAFRDGEKVVVILESEYERLKALDKRNDETDVPAMWRQIGKTQGFVE